MATLVAIPVYNEEKYLAEVLRQTLVHPVDVLVVDDGSTDKTPEVLRQFSNIEVIRQEPNRGYGAALRTAFKHGCDRGYDLVITMDSDGQHEPSLIPAFERASDDADIVSGSRYLSHFSVDTPAPADRRRINSLVTDELNACFGLGITDSFCGFKAYRTEALLQLQLREDGYAMPLELWVQAACRKLRIREIAVPRVYLDPKRSFGETLDIASTRLAYYQEVIDRAVAVARQNSECGMKDSQSPIFQR
ncbi:MAG: glycosyltransferase [Planctomycetota bacterium]